MDANMQAKQLKLSNDLAWLKPTIVEGLMRVGSEYDGGYVMPEKLISDAEVLISFGLSDDWSFEEEFLDRNPNISIHAYDYTISLKAFRRRYRKALLKILSGKLSKLHGYQRERRILKSYQEFFRGKVQHYENRIHNRNDMPFDVTIEQVLAKTSSDKIFVKMDIESAEYRVIPSLVNYHNRILGYAIEFHDTEPLRTVFKESVERLQSHYTIVHVHPNNFGGVALDNLPESLEITFLRNDYVAGSMKRSELLLMGLDAPCDYKHPEYALSFSESA